MIIRGSNSSSLEVREGATYKPGVEFVELREMQKMQKQLSFINKPMFTCHSLLISQNLFSIDQGYSQGAIKFLHRNIQGVMGLGNCVLLLVCKVKCLRVYLLNYILFLFSKEFLTSHRLQLQIKTVSEQFSCSQKPVSFHAFRVTGLTLKGNTIFHDGKAVEVILSFFHQKSSIQKIMKLCC